MHQQLAWQQAAHFWHVRAQFPGILDTAFNNFTSLVDLQTFNTWCSPCACWCYRSGFATMMGLAGMAMIVWIVRSVFIGREDGFGSDDVVDMIKQAGEGVKENGQE